MTKTKWLITLSCGKSFTMVGPPMTHAEALKEVRLTWPDAEIE